MKQYALYMYQPVGVVPPPEFLEKVMQEIRELRRELEYEEAYVFGGGLEPPDASTVVRAVGGQAIATDGPYADGKEFLGGMTVIKVPSLDEALEWAGRYALVTGLPIEVRPFQGDF
ncbi:YciI family protein [Actinomadura roseirufa]|uniref:YciI family protein n=1 Tax=Actinomadura roseirufa TaxID=2094049 RepID=UPI00104161C3|nr:YciI family protein [Actinomadura roseirufa]